MSENMEPGAPEFQAKKGNGRKALTESSSLTPPTEAVPETGGDNGSAPTNGHAEAGNGTESSNVIQMPTPGSGSKYATKAGFGIGTAVRAFTPVLLGKSRTYMRANVELAAEVSVVDAAKAGSMNKDLYVVEPGAVEAGALQGITTGYDALMVPLIDRDGIAFLWEIRRLNRDGIQLPSYDEAMRVLEGTTEKPGLIYAWGRIVFQSKGYILDNAPKPEILGEPKWPSNLKTLDQWIEAGFPGKIIRDPDHKILQRLRGWI